MLTLDMQPAQELRGLPGVDWWRLDLELPEVTDRYTHHLHSAMTFVIVLFTVS